MFVGEGEPENVPKDVGEEHMLLLLLLTEKFFMR